MVTLDNMCRTVNGLDVNALDVFKQNIQSVINNDLDNIIDYFSGAQKDGRGNIAPVTIIMPTLAMQTIETTLKHTPADAPNYEEQCVNNFIKLLTKKIHEAKDMLL